MLTHPNRSRLETPVQLLLNGLCGTEARAVNRDNGTAWTWPRGGHSARPDPGADNYEEMQQWWVSPEVRQCASGLGWYRNLQRLARHLQRHFVLGGTLFGTRDPIL